MSKRPLHIEKRINRLRETYREARQWHHLRISKLDELWSVAIDRIRDEKFPMEPNTILDALESALICLMVHVTAAGPAEKRLRK